MNLKDGICKLVDSIIDEKDDSIKLGTMDTCSSDSECNPDLCDKTRGKCFKYIKSSETSAYPIDVFVRLMFESNVDYSKPFEYMLKTLGMSNCVSLLHIGYFTDKNSENESKFIDIQNETVSSFYYKYAGTSCIGFSVIDIYIKMNDNLAHVNVMLVENIKDFLIWNYYEPHGYNGIIDENVQKMKEMGELCAKIAGKKFIFNQREGAQCPRGIQGLLTGYDPGYCLIFSYFWIWCVLSVIKRMDMYIPSNKWISFVEECVADYIKRDPKLVYKRVISFAYKMYNNMKHSSETLKDSLTGGSTFIKKFKIDGNEYDERVSLSEIGENRGKHGEQFASHADSDEDEDESEHSDIPDNIANNKILSYIYDHLNTNDKIILLKSIENGMTSQIEHSYKTRENIEDIIVQLNNTNKIKEAGFQDLPEDVNEILKKTKFDITHKNALVKASEKGYLPIVEYLINNGADIYSDGDEALRVASKNGNRAVVRYLAMKGANIHAYGENALKHASENGHLPVVQYLVENGADIHSENDYAFRIASNNGYLPVVKYLFEKGADIHAEYNYSLRHASKNGHLSVVKYLVEKGADIHEDGGERSLLWSVESNHLPVVQYLVENGADIHVFSDYALKSASEDGYLPIVQYLIEKGAEINEIDLSTVKDPKTIKFLVENGAKSL